MVYAQIKQFGFVQHTQIERDMQRRVYIYAMTAAFLLHIKRRFFVGGALRFWKRYPIHVVASATAGAPTPRGGSGRAGLKNIFFDKKGGTEKRRARIEKSAALGLLLLALAVFCRAVCGGVVLSKIAPREAYFSRGNTVDIVNNASGMVLVEKETGAVVENIGVGDKVRIIPAVQLTAQKEMKADTIPFGCGRRFVKLFPDNSKRLCERLSPNALWILQRLVPYVGMNGGVLRHSNGKPLKRADVARLCLPTLAERTADRAVTELCNCGVMGKAFLNGKRVLLINPYVLQNGSNASASLLKVFEETEWASIGG